MAKKIEENLLEEKKNMVVQLDLVYTLSVHKGIITDEERTNQIAYTLLNTCLRLHKQIKAVGIDHVRIQVDKTVGKPRDVLEEYYERVMSVCVIIIHTSENIVMEDLAEQFGIEKSVALGIVPELATKDLKAFFPPHTPIRQLVKRFSAFNMENSKKK